MFHFYFTVLTPENFVPYFYFVLLLVWLRLFIHFQNVRLHVDLGNVAAFAKF